MKINKEMEGLIEVSEIENSKSFQRLSEKTQVLVPETGQVEVVKNRLTHSYEVYTSAKLMATNIAGQLGVDMRAIDYNNCLKQACLLHDIGHPPFGHDGAKLINQTFINLGLSEGFSDNNNNLVIIENHGLNLRDYVKTSVIKYPEKLYPSQKEKYLPLLDKSLQEDKEHYSQFGINLNNQKQTIACQIMDEADRNSYTCSDLTDFFCLGNKVSTEELKEFINMDSPKQFLLAKQMFRAIESDSKTQVRDFFLEMKNAFNFNYKLTDNGLEVIDKELYRFRESLSKIEHKFFIQPIRKEEFHIKNIQNLEKFIKNSLEGFCESNIYKEKINNSISSEEKLQNIRDMISEVSDWYIINHTKNNKLKNSNRLKTKIN